MHGDVRHLKMAELSVRSSISASRIRYYLRLGLLPQPLRTAKTMAYYGPEHVERLAHIRRRLQAGATLRAVRTELADHPPPIEPGPNDEVVHSSQRARLVDAGAALLLRSGFEATSVDDVVARAGAGKASFYRQFSDKRDLLLACIERELDWYERATSTSPPSLERLLGHAELFKHRRTRSLIDLVALLRQADASRAIEQDERLESVRDRLRVPLEADLLTVPNGPRNGEERYRAEMLLSIAEYLLAYAAQDDSREIADLVRRAWNAVLWADDRG